MKLVAANLSDEVLTNHRPTVSIHAAVFFNGYCRRLTVFVCLLADLLTRSICCRKTVCKVSSCDWCCTFPSQAAQSRCTVVRPMQNQ